MYFIIYSYTWNHLWAWPIFASVSRYFIDNLHLDKLCSVSLRPSFPHLTNNSRSRCDFLPLTSAHWCRHRYHISPFPWAYSTNCNVIITSNELSQMTLLWRHFLLIKMLLPQFCKHQHSWMSAGVRALGRLYTVSGLVAWVCVCVWWMCVHK